MEESAVGERTFGESDAGESGASTHEGSAVEETAIADVVRRVLREGPFAMRQLAQDSGLSYDVLRSWRSGRRRPNPESVRKLADGIARRSELLRELARDLRRFG